MCWEQYHVYKHSRRTYQLTIGCKPVRTPHWRVYYAKRRKPTAFRRVLLKQGKKRPLSLLSFVLASIILAVERKKRHGCLIHAVYRPCAFETHGSRPPKNAAAPRTKTKQNKSRRNRNTRKQARQKRSSTATAANSIRLAMAQVSRTTASSSACADAGFMAIGYVQFSQSLMMRKHDSQYTADRHTDGPTH